MAAAPPLVVRLRLSESPIVMVESDAVTYAQPAMSDHGS
jgi:hypothetical protein